MEFEQTVRLRKSVRSFTDEQITKEELQKLLAAAHSAPIAGGDYSKTHMTVVQDPQVLSQLREACMTTSRKTGNMMDAFYGAQTLIFLSAQDVSDDHIEYCNVACIIENILLQAAALELGAVYIWGCLNKLRANEEALRLLALPEGYEILSAVALGHAAKPPVDRELKENIAVTLI